MVVFGLKKSIWVELEFLVGILSVFFFLYQFYILFHGIRFDPNEKYDITWQSVDFSSVLEGTSCLDTFGTLASAGGDGGILGLVIGFIIDLVVSIILAFVIAFVFWAGVNLFFSSVFILFLPAFYLFKRSLRFVIAKGRYCYKNYTRSVIYSLRATFTGAIWFYIIIFLGHYFSNIVNKNMSFG